MDDEIIYDNDSETYYIRRNVEGQTIELGMDCEYWSESTHTAWFNIYITIFNKRKDMWDNMDKKVITGKNPFKTFSAARDMFYKLEAFVIEEELIYHNTEKLVLFCTWVDNRRRDAYYKVLSKFGYSWGTTPKLHRKCIMKTYTVNDLNSEVWEEENE